MRISRRGLLSGAAALIAGGPALGQTFPNRPITLVSPFAAGGGTDILGRLIAPKFGELLGSTVIVENRAGAGGNLGAQGVARAQADGHTLLMAVTPIRSMPISRKPCLLI